MSLRSLGPMLTLSGQLNHSSLPKIIVKSSYHIHPGLTFTLPTVTTHNQIPTVLTVRLPPYYACNTEPGG